MKLFCGWINDFPDIRFSLFLLDVFSEFKTLIPNVFSVSFCVFFSFFHRTNSIFWDFPPSGPQRADSWENRAKKDSGDLHSASICIGESTALHIDDGLERTMDRRNMQIFLEIKNEAKESIVIVADHVGHKNIYNRINYPTEYLFSLSLSIFLHFRGPIRR